jgi:FHA domain/Domain of unknown function (DUF4878)
MEAALNSPYGRTILGPAGMTIGRSPDNQLVVNDPQASSHHAQIYPDGQGYLLVDLGSTNGTFVNEQRLIAHSPRMLNAGDVLRIGNTSFSYEAIGASQDGQIAPGQYGGPAYEQTIIGYNPVPQASQQPYPQQPQQSPDYQGYTPPVQQPYAPAPGQVGFPGYPATAVQSQKKSRLGLWIALIVIVLLVAAGGVGGYVYLNRSTPEKTLTTYCNALQSGDYQTAYNQLSSSLTSKFTEPQFAQLSQVSFAAVGGLKSCTVSNVQENGSTATGTITGTFGNGKTQPSPVSLVNQNGTWKLTSSNP